MMSKVLPRQSRRRLALPSGLLGMLALVSAVEGLIAWRSLALTPISSLGAQFSATQATSGATACQVLALGDSSIKFGLDPKAFESRLGLRAYNLAVPGSPPPVAYFLLRRALDAGAKPLALLVGFVSLSSDSRDWTLEYAEFLSPLECLDLAWAEQDARLFGRLILARLLPSMRYRPALRAVLSSALRLGGRGPVGNPGRGAALASLRAWAESRGASLNRAGLPFNGRLNPTFEAVICSQPWPVRDANARYLARTASLARSAGIQVFWVIPPLVPTAQAIRDALGLEAGHERDLRALHARLADVVVLDARRSGYSTADFVDPCHLNARAAGYLSAGIAEVLEQHLGRAGSARADRPVWAELPHVPHAPAAIATGTQPPLAR